jgi:hypothetical protein
VIIGSVLGGIAAQQSAEMQQKQRLRHSAAAQQAFIQRLSAPPTRGWGFDDARSRKTATEVQMWAGMLNTPYGTYPQASLANAAPRYPAPAWCPEARRTRRTGLRAAHRRLAVRAVWLSKWLDADLTISEARLVAPAAVALVVLSAVGMLVLG